MSAAIVVEGLSVRRGGRLALGGVSLTVDAGHVVGLLGPSGSGKTTLMRAIVGVQRIEAGTVRVLDAPAGAAALRRRVAYLTQSPSVYADLDVRENLEYFAQILDAPPQRIDETLRTVGLDALARRRVRGLSGGEVTRVSLAVALLAAPAVLVLDEPTVGLDPLLRRDLWRTFRDLAGAGAALLVSSHVMEEARHCDRLVLLRDGRIVATGSPDELLAATGTADLDAAFLALAQAQRSPGMSPHIVAATAGRVLRQLRHDPRTVALVLAVPAALLTVLRYVLDRQPGAFQRTGIPLIGVFPLVSMFLVTSIALLRERTSGTLERLMTMPLAKADLLFGYGLAFAGVALLQATITATIGLTVLGLDVQGSLVLVLTLAVLNAVLGSSFGLFASAFAATEFQVVQFMPAFVLPQLLVCGLLAPRAAMAAPLRWISDLLPMTYAYDGLRRAGSSPHISSALIVDIVVVAGATVAALVLAALTLPRRTP